MTVTAACPKVAGSVVSIDSQPRNPQLDKVIKSFAGRSMYKDKWPYKLDFFIIV